MGSLARIALGCTQPFERPYSNALSKHCLSQFEFKVVQEANSCTTPMLTADKTAP
ncbi:MAG: hypothetical protein JWR22_2761 [Herminiimonas sp.]|nr:hypothetical protein [Herminiimonas sp.]